MNDNFQLHFIELKKWTKLSVKARNRLERWLLFLANNNPIELEEAAMKDVTLTRALEAEKMFLSNKEARYIYNLREKARLDLFSSIATAEERGKKEGKAEGIAEGIERTAINLMQLGLEMDKIQKATGLSLNDLENLKAKSIF